MPIIPVGLVKSLVLDLRRIWFCGPGICCCLFVIIALAACSQGGGNSGPASSPLSQLHWCGGKPLMLFRDEAASGTTAGKSTPVATTMPVRSTPTTITNWNQVKSQLGFTTYLPESLPVGTCLMSASGTLHDPVFGSSFTVGFMLPDHNSISLSEALARSQRQAFQCSPENSVVSSGTPAGGSSENEKQQGMQVCTGVHGKTNIVFSARGAMSDLQTFFQNLQPDVNWEPAT